MVGTVHSGDAVNVADVFTLLQKNAPQIYAELQSRFPDVIAKRSAIASPRAINVERQGATKPDAEQLAAMLAGCRSMLTVSNNMLRHYMPRARRRLQISTAVEFYGQLIAFICSLSIVSQVERLWAPATIVAAALAAVGCVFAHWAQLRLGGAKDAGAYSLPAIVNSLQDANTQLLGLNNMLAVLDPSEARHADAIVTDAALVNKVAADISKTVGNPLIYDSNQTDFSL